MSLLAKPDWEETKERYTKLWNGEYIGRAAISIVAPRILKEYPAPPQKPAGFHEQWTDLDYIDAKMRYEMATTAYLGECVPLYNAGFPGIGQISAYVGDGSQIWLNEWTAHREPIYKEGPLTDYSYQDFAINPDNKWLKHALKAQEFIVKQAQGKMVPSIVHYINSFNDLGDLRGNMAELYDLYDNPEYLVQLDDYFSSQSLELARQFYAMPKQYGNGDYSLWLRMWAPGSYNVLQCDFSYMVSSHMYDTLMAPNIQKVADQFEYNGYHVDGEGSFKHIDTICHMRNVQVLQLVPGAGKPSCVQYMKELKKIQSYGKIAHIWIPPEDVKIALEYLSADKLYIETWCRNEEEGKDLLRYVEKNSHVYSSAV